MEEFFESDLNSYNKISIPKSIFDSLESRFIELKIEKDNSSRKFLALANRRLTVRKHLRRELCVGPEDSVLLKISEVERSERPNEIISNGHVDMLSLIPEKTSRDYEMVVSEFEKGDEEWLRVWYPGGSKGARQIEIRRFVDSRLFGELLGQYQAEGKKSIDESRIEFTNKLISEHRDFVDNLLELGVSKYLINSCCIYNSDLVSEVEVEKYCSRFEAETGIDIEEVYRINSRGPMCSRTYIRNGTLAEILFNAMCKVRKSIVTDISDCRRALASGFVRKLLTGDGTLDTNISSAKEHLTPSINIKIVDENEEALEDYKKILSNLGFHPHINYERIWTRSSCSLEDLIFLYRIKAFKNTKNWRKLILSVSILLEGRRYKTYKRFVELRDDEPISTTGLAEKYDISRRSAQDWIKNKQEEGLLSIERESPFPKLYSFTDKAHRFSEDLKNILQLESDIKEEKGVEGSKDALERVKSASK